MVSHEYFQEKQEISFFSLILRQDCLISRPASSTAKAWMDGLVAFNCSILKIFWVFCPFWTSLGIDIDIISKVNDVRMKKGPILNKEKGVLNKNTVLQHKNIVTW